MSSLLSYFRSVAILFSTQVASLATVATRAPAAGMRSTITGGFAAGGVRAISVEALRPLDTCVPPPPLPHVLWSGKSSKSCPPLLPPSPPPPPSAPPPSPLPPPPRAAHLAGKSEAKRRTEHNQLGRSSVSQDRFHSPLAAPELSLDTIPPHLNPRAPRFNSHLFSSLLSNTAPLHGIYFTHSTPSHINTKPHLRPKCIEALLSAPVCHAAPCVLKRQDARVES